MPGASDAFEMVFPDEYSSKMLSLIRSRSTLPVLSEKEFSAQAIKNVFSSPQRARRLSTSLAHAKPSSRNASFEQLVTGSSAMFIEEKSQAEISSAAGSSLEDFSLSRTSDVVCLPSNYSETSSVKQALAQLVVDKLAVSGGKISLRTLYSDQTASGIKTPVHSHSPSESQHLSGKAEDEQGLPESTALLGNLLSFGGPNITDMGLVSSPRCTPPPNALEPQVSPGFILGISQFRAYNLVSNMISGISRGTSSCSRH